MIVKRVVVTLVLVNLCNTGNEPVGGIVGSSKRASPKKMFDPKAFFEVFKGQFEKIADCNEIFGTLETLESCDEVNAMKKGTPQIICYRYSDNEIDLKLQRNILNFEINLKFVYDPIKNLWDEKFPIDEYLSKFCHDEKDLKDVDTSQIIFDSLEKAVKEISTNRKTEYSTLTIEPGEVSDPNQDPRLRGNISFGLADEEQEVYKVGFLIGQNEKNKIHSLEFYSSFYENTIEFTSNDKSQIYDEIIRLLPILIKNYNRNIRFLKHGSDPKSTYNTLNCAGIKEILKELEKVYIVSSEGGNSDNESQFTFDLSCKPLENKGLSIIKPPLKFEITCKFVEMAIPSMNYNVLKLVERSNKGDLKKQAILEISLLENSINKMEMHVKHFKTATSEFLRYACPVVYTEMSTQL
jgi:hypothetical protein